VRFDDLKIGQSFPKMRNARSLTNNIQQDIRSNLDNSLARGRVLEGEAASCDGLLLNLARSGDDLNRRGCPSKLDRCFVKFSGVAVQNNDITSINGCPISSSQKEEIIV
jgi:hypothetical protein